MINKWLGNLRGIAGGEGAGKCSFCGSVNTDYKCSVVDQKSKIGYMDIWCNDCKKAFHISRMQVAEDMKTYGEMPKDLKY